MTIANNYVMDGTGAWVPMAGSVTGSVSIPAGTPGAVTLTDASIASATGASQTIVAASSSRQTLIVSNPSAGVTWWINPSGGTAAPNAAGSFALAPGARWEPKPPPANAVTGIATAATALTVKTGDAAGTFFNVGTLGAQNANAVAITGGTIAGITSLGVSGNITATQPGATQALFTAINGTGSVFLRMQNAAGAVGTLNNTPLVIYQNDLARVLIDSTTVSLIAGTALQLGNNAVTGLVAGALAATTNASIVIKDGAGVSYRIPCIV